MILVRLGPTIDKAKLADKSTIISSVGNGDTFSVAFTRDNFEKKRDALALNRLGKDKKVDYFAKLRDDLAQAERKFDGRFEAVFASEQKGAEKFIQF